MDVSKINYSIAKDIGFIMEAEGITLEEVSLLTSISRTTLYEIIDKNYTIDSVYEKFYSYVYNLKYRLNSVKEDLLKETNKHIVLFHGSKFGLKEVCVNGARSTCDFGNGFYLGETYDQALSFVCENEKSSVYSFIFDLNGLNVKMFDCSLEWMIAICYYRGTIKEFEDSELVKSVINKVKSADVIIAPIADNRMFYIMSLFAAGEINAEVALHSLSASKLGLQYIIKTEKAIKKLNIIEKYYLCKEEKIDCQERLNARSLEIDTKLKMAKREFREGLFIEELLK